MKFWRKLSLLLTCLLLSATSSAAQDPKVVKVLPNGEPVFEWNGVKYRGLAEAHADRIDSDLFELKKLREALPICEKVIEANKVALQTAQQQVASADRLVTLANETSAKNLLMVNTWKAQYEDEHKLRLDAEKFIHRGGRVSAFFEQPVVQLAVKIGLPVVGMIVKK